MTHPQPDVTTPQPGAAAPERPDPVLEVRNLDVTYGHGESAVRAIDGLSLSVARHEFVCIVGPSGCGKTTLLKSLAGLLRPTSGEIVSDGTAVRGGAPPAGLALVFQEYTRSLLPWLTVSKNVTFPLRKRGVKREALERAAAAALAEVGLDGFGDRYPWELSGGMQQRVAIARAIAYEPTVLLMDEPFASVDAQTRADLEDLILRVRADTGMSIVLVTHDIDEAVYLGDRVVVLSKRPTRVLSSIDSDLPGPRDQLSTKAHPAFVDLRTRVLREIRADTR